MNISKAKEQIRNAITAYLTKDDLGNYVIPVEKQRPVLLIGPPGIGKTAIMEQLASELGIGLIFDDTSHPPERYRTPVHQPQGLWRRGMRCDRVHDE